MCKYRVSQKKVSMFDDSRINGFAISIFNSPDIKNYLNLYFYEKNTYFENHPRLIIHEVVLKKNYCFIMFCDLNAKFHVYEVW